MLVLTISLIIIALAIIIATFWIFKQKNGSGLIKNRRQIEQLPTMISTLGVVGTFVGITIGLMKFDPANLNDSIPELLDGLKTAFWTSLAGMGGSILLSRWVSRLYDNADDGVSDINIAAGEITKAVSQMSQAIIDNTNQQAQIQAAFQNTLTSQIDAIKGVQKLSFGTIEQILTTSRSFATDSQIIKETISNIDRNLGEISGHTEAIASIQQETLGEVNKLGGKLHNEVVEIEDKMEDTTKLLESKFAEFSELLQKSNTEALVEVMKQVTEEFNKQMNDLISRLVQENFEQLNKSVEQLNTWQQENKVMIAALTMQYKEMAENFENTSTTLSAVGRDTRSLVSDGSKLQTIVKALDAVMIQDEKFIQIATNLTQSAELNKESMVEFKDAQSALNDWVRKQRNFVEAVQALMAQLQDIAKINDYSETFWSEARKGMNDSVSILKSGASSLNAQITSLDASFYERLNDTLAQLDNCIQKMVQHYKRS